MRIEFLVADFIMQLASSISAMKVDIPFSCASEAPTLVIIASIMGRVAYSQGTKQPICANKTVIAIYLIYVLFPPIFGPVIICNNESFLSILQLLETHSDLGFASKSGCLDPKISIPPPFLKTGFVHKIWPA